MQEAAEPFAIRVRDLVVGPGAIADAAARRALFDVVTTHGADRLSPGGLNRLFLRSANTGNVDLILPLEDIPPALVRLVSGDAD